MAELLVEIRADAFDVATLALASQVLRETLARELSAAGLPPRQAATAGTARRLVVLLRVPDAAGGVLQAGEALPGATASRHASHHEAVRAAVQGALEGCPWPWRDDAAAAARFRGSLRGVLAIHGGGPLEVAVWGLAARPETVGHPLSSPAPFAVDGVEHYRTELLRRGIEIRIPERRRWVRDRLFAAAASAGGELAEDAALLELVTAGCEIPGVVVGELEPEHLGLPRELVATALRERLQAFLLVHEGRLLPRFLAVVDRPDDPGGRSARGVSWTASALLHDLGFHWQRDRRVPLAQRARELEGEASRDGLGTHGQRAERLEGLVRELGREWGWIEDVERAAEAVRLLHADSATALAQELPALRGVIAGLLARDGGYPDSVWQALYDHDRAATGTSLMPRGRCGMLVAFVHWADLLAGVALARDTAGTPPAAGEQHWHVARALIRVALHRGLPVDLRLLAGQTLRRYGVQGFSIRGALAPLVAYLEAAADSLLRDDGFAAEEIAAVLGASASSLLGDVQGRLRALRDLRRDPALAERLAPLARTARRLEALLGDAAEQRLDLRSLSSDEEKDVFVSVQAAARKAASLTAVARPDAWLEQMEQLDAALQRLLRKLLVRDQDEQLRRNRLALLQEARRLYTGQVRLAELAIDDAPSSRPD